MALFNEIQRAGLNAILHKTLAMEDGAPAPQLSGDIVPVLVLESERPEWHYLAGGNLCWGSAYLTPGAGVRGRLQLWNPPGAGVLCVIEALFFCTGTLDTWEVRDDAVQITGTGLTEVNAWSRDYRKDHEVACQLFYTNDGGAVSGVRRMVGQALASTMVQPPIQALILPPGRGISITNTTVNTTLVANFVWRERTIEPSESR